MFMLCYIMHQDVFTYVTPVRNGHEKMFKFQHRHCVNIQNKVIRLLNEFKFKDRRFQVLYSRNISTLVFVFKQIAWYNGGQKFLRNITMIKPTEQ